MIPLKSGTIHKKTAEGKTIVKHTYELDEYKRRVTLPNVEKAKNYMAFMGCSFTFGIGVNDGETMPSQAQQSLNHTRIYNYGVNGAGPIDILFRLKSIERKEMKEKKGVILYIFFKGQMDRLLNRPEYVASSNGMNIVY